MFYFINKNDKESYILKIFLYKDIIKMIIILLMLVINSNIKIVI